jgi:glucokinase
MKSTYACGVDIGGSHITAAIIELAGNTILKNTVKRASINSSKTVTEIINEWTSVIRDVLKTVNGKRLNIGIAIPGPFDYDNGISYISGQHKYEALYDINVKTLLSAALEQPAETITFANDAACFLQGEVAGGIAKGHGEVLGFTLGTGFGSAKYDNGIAEDADLWQRPFLDGIAEDYLSSRWFVKRYYQVSKKTVEGVKELMGAYYQDEYIPIIFEEFGFNFGLFIKEIIENQEIDMIVIGGNIAQALELFRKGINKGLIKSHNVPVIEQSILWEHAPLIGAVNFNTLITAL